MEQYLAHWWAGELAQHYHPLGFSIAQFNKLLKVGQYTFGLLALFELVQFSVIMSQLRFVSASYVMMNRLPWALVSNTLTLIPKILIGILAVARGRTSASVVLGSTVNTHYKDAIKRVEAGAQDYWVARAFQWLADHPLPERARRIVVFSAFALLSLGDLLTS